jgi:hypothetical protein
MKDALGHGSNDKGLTPAQQENQPFKSRLSKAAGHSYLDPHDPRGAHSTGVQALPNMERRHFEAIAAEFKSQPDVGTPGHLQRVNEMADKLSTTNPAFRRDFFVKAATGGGYNDKSRGRTSGMSKAAGVIKQMRK